MDIDKIEHKEEKIALAKKILDKVKDGQTIGIGSGSTVYLAVIEIQKLMDEKNWNITAIPASDEIEELCKKNSHIKIGNLVENEIDWAFDGADEIDENNNLIKGGGKALFREKLNMLSTNTTTYILVDNTKFVKKLGEKHLLPVEVFPRALNYVADELRKIGATEIIYKGMTDNNNSIINVKFENTDLDEKLAKQIKLITGVIETGLFCNFKITVVK